MFLSCFWNSLVFFHHPTRQLCCSKSRQAASESQIMGNHRLRGTATCLLSRAALQLILSRLHDLSCSWPKIPKAQAWVVSDAAGSPAACSCAPLTSSGSSPQAQQGKHDDGRPLAPRLFPVEIREHLFLVPFRSQCKIPVWKGFSRAMYPSASAVGYHRKDSKEEEICLGIVRVSGPWGHS